MSVVSEKFEENGIGWKYINIAIMFCLGIMYIILSSFEVFWYDEAYTVGMILRDYSEIIEITSRDVHTPFYYFVLKFFYETFGGHTLISIKLFSVLFLMLYVVLGGYLVRRHYNRQVEFFWLILSGFMPAMVIQSTSARMYTFALFWVTCASYLAYSLYLQESRRKWILLVVATIIAIYIHTFSMIEMVIVYCSFIVAVLVKKRYQTLKRIFIAGVIVAVSYLPWLFVLWRQFSRWAGWESGWSNTIEQFSFHSIKVYMAEWFSSIENPQPFAVIFGLFLFFISGIFAMRYVKEQKQWMPVLGLLIALIVLIIAVLITIFIVPCFLGRYLFPLAGTVWLFVAVGMYRMKNRWLQVALIVGILSCGLPAYFEELRLENESGLSVYRDCIENEWEEGDVIMADAYFTLMMSIYFPEAEYMVYGSMPNCIPFDNCTVFTKWEQLEGVDTVWYLSFSNFRVGNLYDKYQVVESKDIPFSYYNIVLEKCVSKE